MIDHSTSDQAKTSTRCWSCGRDVPAEDADAGGCLACLWKGVVDADEPNMEPGGGGTVAGHEMMRELARGGMGVVYLARQISPAREVAVKMLLPWHLDDPSQRARFQLEAEALSQLDHPAILPLYQAGTADGVPWFSMKLASGGTLASRSSEFAGQWRQIAELVSQLAAGIAYAHERGVLHRDLKPANVLFDEENRPCLVDFGLAKMMDQAPGHALTRSQSVMGTPQYLAPEVAEFGAAAATTLSDVYGLGALLYELLAQRPPFLADSLSALMHMVRQQDPPALSGGASRVPRELDIICQKCLSKAPSARYATAGALADDLKAWLEGRPISAQPATLLMRMKAWSRRRPALAAASAMLVLAGSGAAIAQWISLRQTQAARLEAESLVEYMSGTLTDTLAPMGRLDLLTGVNDRVAKWHAGQPPERQKSDPHYAGQKAKFLCNLARAEYPAGNYAGAEKHLMEALQVAPPGDASGGLIADAHELLGSFILGRLGRKEAARSHLLEALQWHEKSNDAIAQGRIKNSLALLALDQNRVDEAEAIWKESVALLAALGEKPGASVEIKSTLSETEYGFGCVAQARSDWEGAARHFRSWRDQCHALAAAHPHDPALQNAWATASSHLGTTLIGQPATRPEAHAAYRDARSVYKSLGASDPLNLRHQHALAIADLALGRAMAGSDGDAAEAEMLLLEAASLEANLLTLTPDPTPWLSMAVQVFDQYASALHGGGKAAEADAFLLARLDDSTAALNGTPARFWAFNDILNIACRARASEDLTKARELTGAWLKRAEEIIHNDKKQDPSWTGVAMSACAIEALHCCAQEPAKAMQLYSQSLAFSDALLTVWPAESRLNRAVSFLSSTLADLQLAGGKPEEAGRTMEACFARLGKISVPLHHEALPKIARSTWNCVKAMGEAPPASAVALAGKAMQFFGSQGAATEDENVAALRTFSNGSTSTIIKAPEIKPNK